MERNTKLDALKGLLIIFVILGHILGFTNNGASDLTRFIYSFHMPLFIIISGYCTHKDNKRYWKSLINIYVSFLLFQVLYGFIGYESNIVDYFIQPKWILWYLFSLICWRIIIKLIPNKLDKTKFVLPVSFILGITCGFLPISYEISIQRTLTFFPFFCLGYTLQKTTLLKLPPSKTYILISITIILQVINMYLINTPMAILRGALCYADCNLGYAAPAYRLFYYVTALFSSFTLYRIIPQSKTLSCIGYDSLLYYLYHGILVIGFSIISNKIGIESNFMYIVLELILIIISINIIGKLRMARRLLRPLNLN